jgi:hypothetical protein
MRVTIIPYENRVSVEGMSEAVDCSALPNDVHAIQWYGKRGEIEFWNGYGATTLKMNEEITDFTPYQYLVDAWTTEAKKEIPVAA